MDSNCTIDHEQVSPSGADAREKELEFLKLLSEQDTAVACTGMFAVTAIALLVECLKNNGALGPSKFEDALRSTINGPGAISNRLDYAFLDVLLRTLEVKNKNQNPDGLN
jgi:hypothetical protein